jgi:hypothetical protein
MKKISIVCLSGLLFLAACENTGSSTVGTYEKEETSQSSEKSEGHSGEKHEGEAHGAQATEHAGSAAADTTLKTSGDAPHNASGVEVKTGANVTADTSHTTPKP